MFHRKFVSYLNTLVSSKVERRAGWRDLWPGTICVVGLLTVFATRPSYAEEVITEPEQAGSSASQAVIEGESLHPHVTAGGTQSQLMSAFTQDQWSGDSQLWWLGARPGDRLTLELDVFQAIESIELSLTRASDYAIVQIELDGHPLGAPIDLYDTQVVTTGVLSLTTPQLKVGKHKLAFEIVGANRQAVKSYLFGLDFIRFRGARSRDGASGAPAGDKLVATVDSAE
ncbi:MAG: hypothetical protein KDA51_14570, partial [Planctomycetales bacterium]|nr:hypothetical protein [Planctomycetales bacterium]